MNGSCKRHFPNIERWMKENGVSKKQLAEKIGVSQKTIDRIFSGGHKRCPQLYVREQIKCVTGMTYEEAFKEAEQ